MTVLPVKVMYFLFLLIKTLLKINLSKLNPIAYPFVRIFYENERQLFYFFSVDCSVKSQSMKSVRATLIEQRNVLFVYKCVMFI